jgi:hypothetical protein
MSARKTRILSWSVAVFWSATALSAGTALVSLDLTDFDDDLMHDMDDATKDLEPVLGAQNADAAKNDAQILQNGFKWTENYFVKKGNTADAVKIARGGAELIAAVLKSVGNGDFPAAAAAARDAAKTCRACHDVYKPPK